MVTRGEDVSIEMYDVLYQNFTGDGTNTTFEVADDAVETNVKYTRVYVDNVLTVPTGIVNSALAALTGTSITMTADSTAVTGILTSFTTEVEAGNKIRLDAQANTWALVESVESDTALTLKAPFTGSTGTGAGSVKELATVTLSSAPASGADIDIYLPITKNGAYRLAQAINWSAVSNNQVIPELGTKAETEQTLSTKVGLTLAWVADDNHDLLEKLIANKTADMPMVIAWKQTNTSPTSYILFLETKVDDFGSGATAGGLATITCSLVSKWPVAVKT